MLVGGVVERMIYNTYVVSLNPSGQAMRAESFGADLRYGGYVPDDDTTVIVAKGHLYISKRVCTYVCRGMLVSTQSNLVANYSNSHHPRPNSKMAHFFGSNQPKIPQVPDHDER